MACNGGDQHIWDGERISQVNDNSRTTRKDALYQQSVIGSGGGSWVSEVCLGVREWQA